MASQTTRTKLPILDYIRQHWTYLTRTHADLYNAADDPKIPPLPDGKRVVYLARTEDIIAIENRLRGEMPAGDFQKIELRHLPENPAEIRHHGLLYLPKPWVVPGGRFNEMYGWDSFFIQMGLLRDQRFDLAQDLTDNLLYEIRAYGKILNANRS